MEEAGPASVDGLEVEGVIICPERILKTRLSAAAAAAAAASNDSAVAAAERRDYFVKWMGKPIRDATWISGDAAAAFSRKHSSMVAEFEAKFP